MPISVSPVVAETYGKLAQGPNFLVIHRQRRLDPHPKCQALRGRVGSPDFLHWSSPEPGGWAGVQPRYLGGLTGGNLRTRRGENIQLDILCAKAGGKERCACPGNIGLAAQCVRSRGEG